MLIFRTANIGRVELSMFGELSHTHMTNFHRTFVNCLSSPSEKDFENPLQQKRRRREIRTFYFYPDTAGSLYFIVHKNVIIRYFVVECVLYETFKKYYRYHRTGLKVYRLVLFFHSIMFLNFNEDVRSTILQF